MKYVHRTLLVAVAVVAQATGAELPLLVQEDFESGADRWRLLDPKSWAVVETDGSHVLSQHVKPPSYKPPHRSPFHVALLDNPTVTDFELTLRVKSTHEDYPHRDACLFFGFQDPAHFYYVHLGKNADDHANQIFIVNGEPRAKISLTSTEGTPWTDDWHTVRVRRTTADGRIEVFFDDMEKPAMTAEDKAFVWGRVGVGSFDDTADFDDITLRGLISKPHVDHVLPVGSALGGR